VKKEIRPHSLVVNREFLFSVFIWFINIFEMWNIKISVCFLLIWSKILLTLSQRFLFSKTFDIYFTLLGTFLNQIKFYRKGKLFISLYNIVTNELLWSPLNGHNLKLIFIGCTKLFEFHLHLFELSVFDIYILYKYINDNPGKKFIN
jgi:hypothetical protein